MEVVELRSSLRTVKSRVIIMMIAFALVVVLLVSTFGFYLVGSFQRRTTVYSAEFNLQLVAGLINQDLTSLGALAKWCGTNSQITDYFLKKQVNAELSLKAFERMREELINNRTISYVYRLIVVDAERQKILQLGNFSGSTEPISVYNIKKLGDFKLGTHSEWETIATDPYSIPTVEVLPMVYPVYHPVYYVSIGTVYLAASTNIITDKLSGYNLPEHSSLYLTLGEQNYQIKNEHILPVELKYETLVQNISDTARPKTHTELIRAADGKKYMLVSYPVRSGIVLTQLLPEDYTGAFNGEWAALLFVLCVVIVILAMSVTISMDWSISRPVALLRKKIDGIASGDFSADKAIESDSEIGEVGRGINRLSREVSELMERRVSDEKHRQELKYRMLQSQINPHFIYNTLNSIKWMATIQNANGIAEMTTALSRLLRTVAKDIRKTVPLEEELRLLDDYFLIQHYRYGGSVTLEKKIEDENLLKCEIPRFALQPLVENAIFHGIEPKGIGHIVLKVYREAGDVLISISDDGVGMSTETIAEVFSDNPGTAASGQRQLGMRSVHERIRYAFGEGYGLSIESEPGKFSTMIIRLPARNYQGWKGEPGYDQTLNS
jgi:two-component system sensor histidine kinase YesM